MKAFIYDKRESKLSIVLHGVESVEDTDKKIRFKLADSSEYEVDKKTHKSTIYQN